MLIRRRARMSDAITFDGEFSTCAWNSNIITRLQWLWRVRKWTAVCLGPSVANFLPPWWPKVVTGRRVLGLLCVDKPTNVQWLTSLKVTTICESVATVALVRDQGPETVIMFTFSGATVLWQPGRHQWMYVTYQCQSSKRASIEPCLKTTAVIYACSVLISLLCPSSVIWWSWHIGIEWIIRVWSVFLCIYLAFLSRLLRLWLRRYFWNVTETRHYRRHYPAVLWKCMYLVRDIILSKNNMIEITLRRLMHIVYLTNFAFFV